MPNSLFQTTVAGEITDLFAHRFVVATAAGRILADVGPEGVKRVQPKVGDTVERTGEPKPSEFKVARYRAGGRAIDIERGPKADHRETSGDPEAALAALRSAGFAPVGEPRLRPRHLEFRATRDGETVEVHVGPDGAIRKIKPVEA